MIFKVSRPFNGDKMVFSMVLGIHMQKNEYKPLPNTVYKN